MCILVCIQISRMLHCKEPLSTAVCFQAAADGLAAVVSADGHEVLISAEFLPPSDLIRAAFAALHHVLSAPALNAIACRLQPCLGGVPRP